VSIVNDLDGRLLENSFLLKPSIKKDVNFVSEYRRMKDPQGCYKLHLTHRNSHDKLAKFINENV